jgi:predicted RNase H-like HicB family nuclease
MTGYFGILDEKEGAWGIVIPDLPGCYGGGATAQEALTDAISAARDWIEHRLAKKHVIPVASPVEEIFARAESHEFVVHIPVLMDGGRSVRANISIDAALLSDIDQAAKSRGVTRSAFIADAVRKKIILQY